MGIKLFNFVTLLDFPNVSGLNESNRMKLEKVILGTMASCDSVIPLFGH